ncbi:uncharacterized protein LOC131072255 isoform X2 [Cryptomeria japonica]|uniref:uncharacterized protein LOC131072255 isoform X2 n=1 Tax=Cryptomeria japonica TaxID=3369 RepID=UPI0027DA9DC5|nr:uncharacterized protein LOC131072255 isoform X2 [Cryptomeria japonica]
MRPGDRGDGRRNGNRGLLGGGFAGFPEIGDPFEGFGIFGGGGAGGAGGRSLIEDFFGRDPFDDPFFRRPFGGLFGPPGNLFNSGSLLGGSRGMGIGMGMGMGMGMLGDAIQRPRADFLVDQRPFNPPQQGARRGPVIEELPDDHEAPVSESRPQYTEPIIEHPDDEAEPVRLVHTGDEDDEPTTITTQHQPSQSRPGYTSQSFCYQSSSVSGPGGAYYTSSSARRTGPNGVVEEGQYEEDTVAGIESRRVARALGEKMHAVSRKRNSDGRENTLETLHNLTEVKFDETWKRHGGSSFPGPTNRLRMLEGNREGSSGRSQARLSSNEGFSDETQEARKQLRR